jgi:hypothetical protein
LGLFNIVYFEDEKQIEAYEQYMCGNKDNNTWGSWRSCQEKFNFPCWIMCSYVHHEFNDDYSAIYMTIEEFKSRLNKLINQMDNITQ